jgi:hypothetical protein
MSELRIGTWTMPAADLGQDNPLPPFRTGGRGLKIERSPDIPERIFENMAHGHLPNPLPYSLQDGYTRDLQPRDFQVAVLENEFLRATFLLEFGGRLWSLVHKPSNRELLEVNSVFQLAHLGLRNAWFSGGVEWNIGTTGHSPFTCAPLFAARVERTDGTPILRLYEWERFRRVPFQIDAYLPAGSPVMLLRVRITNPNEHEVPMYWWSNIAVPEGEDTRVIVPADSAYCIGCRGNELARVSIPSFAGTDYTYSANVNHAADLFFHIPQGQRPWIAALDGEGRGLAHVSTNNLFGRKLWVWGMGSGGRKWQKHLSPPGNGYVEIQAGLTRTQLEHLIMPPNAEWSWLEAFGLVEADSEAVHGSDWTQACRAVDDKLEKLIPTHQLNAEFEHGKDLADKPPAELLQRGSGWGALERKRREAMGESPLCSAGLSFDDASLSDEQIPWMTQDGVGWLAWFHLGVMRHYAGDREGASQAWEHSLDQAETPWATRNLAALAWEEGDLNQAADYYVAACRMMPSLLPLVVECGQCLVETGRPYDWLGLLTEIPQPIRSAGRIRLLEARAALAIGNLEPVERFFADRVVIADLREGESTLSDLWFELHEHRLSDTESMPIDAALRERVRLEYPVPEEFDFRIAAD